jgi:hypothetical protein
MLGRLLLPALLPIILQFSSFGHGYSLTDFQSPFNSPRVEAGGPAFDFVCSENAVGAPSLRFVQGRARILPKRLLPVLREALAHAFVVPALRKVREERGTHLVAGASKIKSLGHPPQVCWSPSASSG